MQKNDFEKILEAIKSFDIIIIHRHSSPDGDAIGSQVGLKKVLKANFPTKRIFAVGDEAGRYSFVDESVMDEVADEEYIKKEAELKNGETYISNVLIQVEGLKKSVLSEIEKQEALRNAISDSESKLKELREKAKITEDESEEVSKLSAELSIEREKVFEKLHHIELVKTELIKNCNKAINIILPTE